MTRLRDVIRDEIYQYAHDDDQANDYDLLLESIMGAIEEYFKKIIE